jgi:hypothetical protein
MDHGQSQNTVALSWTPACRLRRYQPAMRQTVRSIAWSDGPDTGDDVVSARGRIPPLAPREDDK